MKSYFTTLLLIVAACASVAGCSTPQPKIQPLSKTEHFCELAPNTRFWGAIVDTDGHVSSGTIRWRSKYNLFRLVTDGGIEKQYIGANIAKIFFVQNEYRDDRLRHKPDKIIQELITKNALVYGDKIKKEKAEDVTPTPPLTQKR